MVDTADTTSCSMEPPVVTEPPVTDPTIQELNDQIMALQGQLTQCQAGQTGGYDDETDDDDHEEEGGKGHAYGKSKKNQ